MIRLFDSLFPIKCKIDKGRWCEEGSSSISHPSWIYDVSSVRRSIPFLRGGAVGGGGGGKYPIIFLQNFYRRKHYTQENEA